MIKLQRKPRPKGKPEENLSEGKIINFTIPRAALATWYFAEPENGERHELMNVLIEPEVTQVGKTKHTKAHVVATNGHRLMHVWWDLKKSEKLPSKILLSRSAVEQHLKISNGTLFSHGRGLKYTILDKREAYILQDSSKNTTVVGNTKVEKAPPNWREVMPKRDDSKSMTPQTYGVNLRYLNDLRKYLNEFHGPDDNNAIGVKINYTCPPDGPMIIIPGHHNEKSEVEVEYALKMGDASAEYILMPMRIE